MQVRGRGDSKIIFSLFPVACEFKGYSMKLLQITPQYHFSVTKQQPGSVVSDRAVPQVQISQSRVDLECLN